MALFISQLAFFTLVGVLNGEPLLTSYPVKAEVGKSFTLICTTYETNIWYINWKRNGVDMFGMGPDMELVGTNKDFEHLKGRVEYSIKPGIQYNVTLISVDPEVDHGSTWNCRVTDEDSNTVVIKVGDLPLDENQRHRTQSSITSSSSSLSSLKPTAGSNSISRDKETTKSETNTGETTLVNTDKDALKDDSTTEAPQLTLDFALIAIGAIGGIVVSTVAGFCIYGAIVKRRKRLY